MTILARFSWFKAAYMVMGLKGILLIKMGIPNHAKEYNSLN